jgi:hypothetical protein
MMPISLALFVSSQITIHQLGRMSPATALAIGLSLQATGLLWWTAVLGPTSDIVLSFVLPAIVFGAGLGVAIVGAFVVCTSGVHGAVQGAASGLVSTTLQFGGAIGVGVMGAIAGQRAVVASSDGLNAAEALSTGHAWALGWSALLVALALPLVLWLRGTWVFHPAGEMEPAHTDVQQRRAAPARAKHRAVAPTSSLEDIL